MTPADLKKHFLENRYVFLLLALLIVVAYLNTLDNAFVSDDIPEIVQNPRLGDLSLGLKNLNVYYFLRSVVFLLFGRNLFAYHTLNILLHVFATFLVYFFVLVVTERKHLSTFTALLFALHPIHTEAVSWISGGGYVLYSLLFLLSFIFYHFYLENRSKPVYLLAALGLYFLSLKASIWALPLPAVFFLYEKFLRGKKINWVFYLILSVIIAFDFFSWQKAAAIRISSLSEGTGSALRNPTITIPHSITQYLYLLFWPVRLTLYHEGEILTSGYLFLARSLTLVLLVILPFILRRSKFFIFFLLLFLISISLSLSPVQIAWYVAERYLYLGSISFCVLLAFLILWLERQWRIKNLATMLLVPILIFYFARTVIRNQDWQSHASIWFATAKVSPRSPRVHNNLGDVYGGLGDLDSAIKEFELARQLQPGYADATHNLGNIYLQKGDLEAAKKYFSEALDYNPNLYQSYFNLGAISYEQGKLEEAKMYFEKVLSINPNYQPAGEALEVLENEATPSAKP